MALKDIFKMTKANRYTADGREELIKAQEAETEDRRYNIGEISEKTGLQKTANGWVKPKKGNAGSAKKDASGATKMTPEQKSKWEAKAANSSETTASLRNFISSMSKPEAKANPHADEIVEIYKKELAKREKNPGYRPEKVYSDKPSKSKPAESTSSAPKTESKPAAETKTEKGPAVPKPSVQEYMKAKQRVKAYEDQYKKDMDDYEYMERIKANGVDTSIFNPMYGGKPKPLEENKSYMEELNKIKAYEATDSAPHVLTGDTRIRVRK